MASIKKQKADLQFKRSIYRGLGKELKIEDWLVTAELYKHCTHTLPNVNAKLSMDACISPNIAFVYSWFSSLKLTAVERNKTHTHTRSFNNYIHTWAAVRPSDEVLTIKEYTGTIDQNHLNAVTSCDWHQSIATFSIISSNRSQC